MHRDIISSNPEGAVNLAENNICTTQGFIIPGKAITVQGHPEFTDDIIRDIVDVREERGIMDTETASDARERAKRAHDGTGIIGRAMWRILGVEC